MKLLILSDTHGRRDRVEDVLTLHSDARAVLFLGDGLRETVELCERKKMPLESVRGNCDLFGSLGAISLPEEQILSFGAYTVLMMHGHTKQVKSGTERAVAYAVQRGADLLLYGHTHVREETYLPAGTEICGIVLKKPLWIFNPGSLGIPNGGEPSYGLLQIRGKDLLLSHGSL